MAHPKIFISSTFYDLRHIRNDLERFIQSLGYEPVLHERGRIPYGSEQRPEEYCYKEIQAIDILVSIIGSRYGSASSTHPYSISQMELKIAHDLGKQVYIFVESAVLSEYRTYLKNRHLKGFQCNYVDSESVYAFIEEVEQLKVNNALVPFDSSTDIVDFLREQWAGLFQRFLAEQGRAKEVQLMGGLQATAQTLDKLVTFLTEERRNASDTVQKILLDSHPAFRRLREISDCPYPVFFYNQDQFRAWLQARSYSYDADASDDQYSVWNSKPDKNGVYHSIRITKAVLFDEKGEVKIYTNAQWREEWIMKLISDLTFAATSSGVTDDDIPF